MNMGLQTDKAVLRLTEYLRKSDDAVLGALLAANAAPATWVNWPFPLAFKLLRRRLGLTQAQLAQLADIDRCQIIRFERGRDIRLSTLRQLFKALDCELLLLPISERRMTQLQEEVRINNEDLRRFRRAVRRMGLGSYLSPSQPSNSAPR